MATSTRFDRLVEEYYSGARCSLCRGLVTATGCPCQKTTLYAQRAQEAMDWYASLPENVRNPRKGFRALPSVRAALNTERAKAGLNDRPMDPNHVQGISAATDDRMGLDKELGIDPKKAKWHKGDMGPERRPYRQRPGVNPPTAGTFGGRAIGPSRTVRRAS